MPSSAEGFSRSGSDTPFKSKYSSCKQSTARNFRSLPLRALELPNSARQELIRFLLDNRVTLAAQQLEFGPIEHGDLPVAVRDRPDLLQIAGRFCDPFTPHTEHVAICFCVIANGWKAGDPETAAASGTITGPRRQLPVFSLACCLSPSGTAFRGRKSQNS